MDVQSNYVYCYLYLTLLDQIMFTITRHVFINIFQMEQFFAVKFDMGCEKKYELSCGTKISKS